MFLAFVTALGLFSLPSASAAGDTGFDIEAGAGQFQLFVIVKSDFDVAESGRSIPMLVEVRDVHGVPQAGIPVRVSVDTGQVSPELVMTDATGRASFTFSADAEGPATADVIARTGLEGAAQGVAGFQVRVVKLPPPPIYARAELVSLGVLSGLMFLVSWTETGRHGMLGLLFPLYTRLKKEQVLDHFVRGQIFGAIRTEPGVNFTAIRRLLGLSNGTLSYHLKTLEVSGFVRSERDGGRKRFFPAGATATTDGGGIQLSNLQRFLMDRLRGSPGVPQRDLARQARVSQQSISYNLRILSREGFLLPVASGRRTHYRVVEP